MGKATTMKTLQTAPYDEQPTNTPNYNINYNDARFQQVETGRTNELADNKAVYDDMAAKSDAAYDEAIGGIAELEQKQTDIQNQQTDLAIEKLEQEQDWARQDYLKEQKGAYADYQKQVDPYGVNAEQMAAQGLSNTGYSESSRVAMYNQYQNRVAIARQSFERTNVEFEMAMKDARLQNSAALAEIALNAWKEKSQLIISKLVANQNIIQAWQTQQNAINSRYDTKWQNVLEQINTENSLKETVRQHNRSYELQNRAITLDEAKFAYEKQQDAAKATVGGGGGSGGGSGGSSKVKGAKAAGKDSTSIRGIGNRGGSGNTTAKDNTKNETDNDLKIDTKSIKAMGLPAGISGTKLEQMEADGLIKSYVEGGKIKFKWAHMSRLGTAGFKGKTTMKRFDS